MSHYKPYPAYRDSGVEWIGQVPEHWEVKRLKFTVASCKNGVWGDEPVGNDEEDIPCVRVADFDRVQLRVVLNNPTMRKVTDNERQGRILKYGDLLLEKSGGGEKQPVGCVVRYEDERPAVCSNFIARIEVAPPYSASFLRNVHHVLYSARLTTNSINQTSGIQNLDQERYFNEYAAFPSLREQEILVSVVDRETARIDALITKKTRFIELLKEKRQALITHAVTKGLDPNVKMRDSGIDWIGEVPEQWNVVQVRHVATLGSGHTPSRSRPDWWEDCYIPWFTLADIWQVRREGRRFVTETEEKVSDLGVANSSAVVHPAGSVMLSRTASVGFPAIMGCDMATSQDFAVWRCGSRVVNEYLYLVLLGMKQELSRLMIGSTHKTIYMPDIEAFRMPLPSEEQQKLIVQYVGDELQRFDTLVAKTQRSIDLLRERRAAFITAAVTGQIDLRESA